LISHPTTIALLAREIRRQHVWVFARSADAPGDMNALMKEACGLLDGRGGGNGRYGAGRGKT